ncbi:site-specific integrase [Saccharicrinis aurantiacus]|uniref:site-specific integrase n=1 Tax=Saccharicrinis aurantiacus TaxID=1849719 RepID=UPI00248F7978|nr:site-specific integrase [Saccharicrinis aurantiacus]
MIPTTFSVTFTARPLKTNKKMLSIYCRVSVDGARTEFSVVKNTPVGSWIPSKERLNSSYSDFRKSNLYIEQVRARITEIHRELVLCKKVSTPQIIKNIFQGKSNDFVTLSYLIDYHNQTQADILSEATFKQYKTLRRYLYLFLEQKKSVNEIYIDQIDFKFLTEFEAFLRAFQPLDHQRKMSNNTVMKHLTKLKKLINLAHKLDWIKKNPYDRFKISYTKVNRGYLTDLEVKVIMTKKLRMERLQLVRDLFIFACYTGLSYIDMHQLKPDNIVLGIDGENWIRNKRQKTHEIYSIPLLPEALSIVNKYREHPKAVHRGTIFPSISNQKINSYLKEIADRCDIHKNLTFHLARHTFATTITLSNGVPIETVSRMLGHTKLTTTQIYARVVENKISDDMKELRTRLSNKAEEDTRQVVKR